LDELADWDGETRELNTHGLSAKSQRDSADRLHKLQSIMDVAVDYVDGGSGEIDVVALSRSVLEMMDTETNGVGKASSRALLSLYDIVYSLCIHHSDAAFELIPSLLLQLQFKAFHLHVISQLTADLKVYEHSIQGDVSAVQHNLEASSVYVLWLLNAVRFQYFYLDDACSDTVRLRGCIECLSTEPIRSISSLFFHTFLNHGYFPSGF
jgi:hypothetical protein